MFMFMYKHVGRSSLHMAALSSEQHWHVLLIPPCVRVYTSVICRLPPPPPSSPLPPPTPGPGCSPGALRFHRPRVKVYVLTSWCKWAEYPAPRPSPQPLHRPAICAAKSGNSAPRTKHLENQLDLFLHGRVDAKLHRGFNTRAFHYLFHYFCVVVCCVCLHACVRACV